MICAARSVCVAEDGFVLDEVMMSSCLLRKHHASSGAEQL
jgi:hypothetical protein